MKINKNFYINGHGFTLVELIVVISVLAILGTIITIIFSRSLRGSNKAQILSKMKQNGQSVLERLDKNIRSSDNIVCPVLDRTTSMSQVTSSVLVYETSGVYTRFKFIPTASTSNGKLIQDNPEPVPITEDDPKIFLQRICNELDIPVDPVDVTDTDTQSGVSVIGNFSRDFQPGFKDVVTIEMVVGPGINALPIVAGDIMPENFTTTITLR